MFAYLKVSKSEMMMSQWCHIVSYLVHFTGAFEWHFSNITKYILDFVIYILT